MKTKKLMHLGQLVAAHALLKEVYSARFITAETTLTNVVVEPPSGCYAAAFDFRIEGYGHGKAVGMVTDHVPPRTNEVISALTGFYVKQFTLFDGSWAYSEFYRSRHGNTEIMQLMHPMLESKLLPLLAVYL